jgi:hypothetical protein
MIKQTFWFIRYLNFLSELKQNMIFGFKGKVYYTIGQSLFTFLYFIFILHSYIKNWNDQ